MSSTSNFIRSTSTLLIFALTWNVLGHAARLSRKLPPQASAQQQAPAPPGPQAAPPAPGMSVAGRMLAAHTVFLAQPTVDPYFAVSPTAAYDAVLNALNQWGRYRIVSDASQADLVLQIHGQVTSFSTSGTAPDYTPDVYYVSTLQLTVADPQSLSPLWVVAAPLTWRPSRKLHTTTVAVAGENVVSNLKQVVGDPLTAQDKADLKLVQTAERNVKRTMFILIGVGTGAVVAGTLIGLHMMHSNAASFCQEHNITPCPGA